MRIRFALVLVAALGFAPTAHATSGTCTVTRMSNVVASYGLTFRIDTTGIPPFPVEFDEAAGTFSMSRDAFATAFPTGVPFTTVGSVLGFIVMDPGTVTGTIDRAGNIVLPNFANHFSTDFCLPRPDYPTSPSLATTRQDYVLQASPYSSQGVPVNPTTGEVTLEGFDVIPAACGAGGPTLNGLHMVCVLSPIPDLSKAPVGPSLEKTRGRAVIGKPLPATPPAKPDKGDVLTLKAKLNQGPGSFDPTSGDTYFELRGATDDVVVVRIPAGKFVKKGKGFRATDKPAKASDPDGEVFDVQKGQKVNGTVKAATGGTLTLTPGKKGSSLAVSLQGLDLSPLAGTARVLFLANHYEASADVTVRGGGRKRTLK
jgi:hypothetical protein